MSGWDTSSRPSWDQPDGPEDSTQAFSPSDLAPDDPWPAPAAAASPPPEFFPDYGQQQEPVRPGFGQEPDLFRRGRHHAAAPNAAYGQDTAYVEEPAYGQDAAYGQDTGYAQETRHGREAAYGQGTAYNADPYGLETTRQNPRLRQDSAKTGWTWVRPTGPGNAPWDDATRQDPGQESARPRFDPAEPRFDPAEPRFDPAEPRFDPAEPRFDPAEPRFEASEPRFDAPEAGRRDAGRSGFDDPETGYRGTSRYEPGRPDASDDFNRRDGDDGRSGWGQQAPSGTGRREREAAARMDPALQDFFAPPDPRPGVPPSAPGRRDPGATLGGSSPTRPGLTRPGQPRPGQSQPGQSQPGQPRPGQSQPGQPQPGQPQPGQPRQGPPGQGVPGGQGGRGTPAANGRRSRTDGWPAASGRRSRTDDWDAPVDAPAVAPRRGDTRPPQRTPGRGPVLGGGWIRNAAIIAVAAVIVVVGVIFLTHKHGTSNSGANVLPTATHKATKAAKPTASPTPSGPVYTLSTPDTAGGFPIGQDPDFLATATTTAQSVVSAVSSGGGGTVKGNPVSASYQLPTDEQTMEFVGYQGTFDPAKVATILASLGSDPHSYPAGPDGGILGCANTTSSTPGGVCVWATTSTLGFVEFFEGTGPETLVTAQAKGAAAVVSLRSGVETKKS